MISCKNENNQLNNRFLEIRRLMMGIYKGAFFISAVNENLTSNKRHIRNST
jgi:hypothetical protein